jgi:hypothetical protein
MLDVDETIEAFRAGRFDFNCKRMVLTQRRDGGEVYEGPGYLRQNSAGSLVFKIYVTQHNAIPLGHLNALAGIKARELHGDELFYDLEAFGQNGTRWTAARIMPSPHWDLTDSSVIVDGEMQSTIAYLDKHQSRHYLRLHFFEEYDVPLNGWSDVKEHGRSYRVRDRATFDACGSSFEVRQRPGSGDTTVEATSETPFPVAFNLRIQEAVQYITAKTAFWRARLESEGDKLHLELASPSRKSPKTFIHPPIWSRSTDFLLNGWRLFTKYLEYVIATTRGTFWNPVAYHLYNARETAGGSLDATAVGLSVAVEALVDLIIVTEDENKTRQLALLQDRMREWIKEQSDLSDVANRATGLINAMGNKRPQDTLYTLADIGGVEKGYIAAWVHLRNKHVHPKLQDLGKSDRSDYQRIIDNIHRVEVLLWQLTFHLIAYDGPFTDYGAESIHTYLTKQYPLKINGVLALPAPPT